MWSTIKCVTNDIKVKMNNIFTKMKQRQTQNCKRIQKYFCNITTNLAKNISNLTNNCSSTRTYKRKRNFK